MGTELQIQNKKIELIQWLSTIEDIDFLEKIVCDVVSKQVGKWFITKVVVSTGVLIAIMQFIIEKYR